MPTNAGGIYVDLGLNSAEFNDGLQKAGKNLNKFGADARRTAGGISSSVGSIGASFAKGLAAPLLALGATGVVTGIRNAASSIASIGDEARRAGVSVEKFSELRFVAEQNRIGVDSLVDGLKELSLRADEFVVTGKGSAAEAFQRLGYGAAELAAKLQDPSALFTEIIGKLGEIDRASAIRIADEIFGGTGGEKFVQLVDQGKRGIEQTIQKAHDLGAVLDTDMVNAATELDRKFGELATAVDMGLKGAIVGAYEALRDFINLFNDVGQRGAGLGGNQPMFEVLSPDAKNDLRLRTQLAGVGQPSNLYSGFATNPDGTLKLAPTTPVAPGKPTKTRSSVSDVEKQKAAIVDLIKQLEFERSQIGLSNVQQEVNNRLREAGAQATPEQQRQIETLVTAIAAETAAIDASARAMEEFGYLAQDALGTFIDDLIEGKDIAQSFGDVLKNLGGQLINLGIQGLTGGLTKALFPGVPGFASGGYTGAGGKYEPAGVVHKGEYVFDAASTKRLGVGNLEALRRGYAEGGFVAPTLPNMSTARPASDNTPSITFAPVIDARGADAGSVARIEAVLQKQKAELIPTIRNEIMRRQKWGGR